MERYIKKSNYEKNETIIISTIIFIIIVFILIIYLYTNKITDNVLLQGVVNTKETIELLVDDEELKLLYKNKIIYIDDKKNKFEINNVTLKILKKNKRYYHDVIIKTNINKKYKETDYIEITIKKDKKRLLRIFELIWKGECIGKNRKT